MRSRRRIWTSAVGECALSYQTISYLEEECADERLFLRYGCTAEDVSGPQLQGNVLYHIRQYLTLRKSVQTNGCFLGMGAQQKTYLDLSCRGMCSIISDNILP